MLLRDVVGNESTQDWSWQDEPYGALLKRISDSYMSTVEVLDEEMFTQRQIVRELREAGVLP